MGSFNNLSLEDNEPIILPRPHQHVSPSPEGHEPPADGTFDQDVVGKARSPGLLDNNRAVTPTTSALLAGRAKTAVEKALSPQNNKASSSTNNNANSVVNKNAPISEEEVMGILNHHHADTMNVQWVCRIKFEIILENFSNCLGKYF